MFRIELGSATRERALIPWRCRRAFVFVRDFRKCAAVVGHRLELPVQSAATGLVDVRGSMVVPPAALPPVARDESVDPFAPVEVPPVPKVEAEVPPARALSDCRDAMPAAWRRCRGITPYAHVLRARAESPKASGSIRHTACRDHADGFVCDLGAQPEALDQVFAASGYSL